MGPGDGLVIASTNPGKIVEVRQILAGLPFSLLTAADVGEWPEVAETGSTYLENARLKALFVSRRTGLATLADDSGIEVDFLGGAPGVHSARYSGVGGGRDATDTANNAKLVAALEGVPAEGRGARYRCVVVLAGPDGTEVVGEGVCEGRIGFVPRGRGGFGYDPWFIPEGETRTMAELSAGEKDAISHRGKALRHIARQLEENL
ncbi:MAG TPA: RdgB/HAM1 family non-canonical purine NTP pyrophosphatase [Actinomycetota bacterium]|nr:RdgB/HAM1 family non-canonical purine NTP pyrophosphatase [Actinomycetota bacterium]